MSRAPRTHRGCKKLFLRKLNANVSFFRARSDELMTAPPTVKIDRIPEEGLEIDVRFEFDWLEEVLAVAESKPIAGREGSAMLRLDLDGQTVIVSGRFDTTLSSVCVACLEPVELAVGAEFSLTLEPETPQVNVVQHKTLPEERELTAAELDVDVYRDGEVDLAQWLREQIVLEAPVHPRHEGQCPRPLLANPSGPHGAHEFSAEDPRLAPLRRITITNKE